MLLFLRLFVFLILLSAVLVVSRWSTIDFGGGDPSEFCWGDPPLTLVEGIQVSFVEVITLCYIFRASVVCLWWIYTILVGASPPTLLERAVLSWTWFRVGCTVYQDFFLFYVCLFYCVHKIYQFCYWFSESALLPSFCTLWLETIFSSLTACV